MPRVFFVLVRPKRPENIGAVARLAANTDLAGIRLVQPGDWRTVEAFRMAWQAEDLLEQAGEFDSLAAAVASCRLVAGLSGRGGDRIPHLTPRELAAEVAAVGQQNEQDEVAVVFGNESSGLTLEERALCQRQVRIPTSTRQPSLNLAQAAMIAAYEIFLANNTPAPDEDEPAEDKHRSPTTHAIRRATAEESERALTALRDAMLSINYLIPEKPEVRFTEWRELFGRAGLTERETRLLMGLARRMRGAAQREQ